ncbi:OXOGLUTARATE/IRON-DEPENDENT DIOXYGENASE [Salix koriyanagi]|uniref:OXOGLUTARATE/IRON-DEPENDENT DIOXYGENASE n=1 Tax=Salix koriyanagi TaxID=2511006 RepID=A0A9Q0T0Q0_9ROSI|nr:OXOGLUTARATE/IRON-DEPENDENT DIOXYGENASE [Salix koriyanagi]
MVLQKSFLDKIRQVARDFFEQPAEEKRRHAKGVEEFEGYGADPVPAEGQSLDWSDRLFLDVYPEDRRKHKFWPENPKSFRKVLEEYTSRMQILTELVSKAMAKSLNLEADCFLNQFGERAALQARFNYYSRCQRPDLVLGLKAHADGSGYTIILQDDVEGLQIFKDERWITAPSISDALLVLMGDQMEIMTNGIFKSPVHRVLTSSEKERISVAVFYTPEPNKEIGPEEGLVNEERPKIYKKVKDYAGVHWEYYQQGKRALHVAKV